MIRIYDYSYHGPRSPVKPRHGARTPLPGTTTGRNQKGQYNGSMTMDDVFDMWAQISSQGFVPDTLLVHPMAWIMWVKDPILRAFALQNGGGSFFANWTGSPASKGNEFFNFGGLGFGQGQQTTATAGTQTSPATAGDLPQNQRSAPQLPSYLGLPFRILVSPFVKFDPIDVLPGEAKWLASYMKRRRSPWSPASSGPFSTLQSTAAGAARKARFSCCG